MLAQATIEGRAHELERLIAAKIAANQLTLPSAPGMALKVLQALRNPNFSLTEAAAIIERDPMLTAQIMRITNSAAFATREPVRSVASGVSRLGTMKLRTVLIEASARKVFESRDKRIAEAIKGLWEHSIAVALLARDVIVRARGVEPEFGYLGGLMHDIGKPVVAGMLLDTEKQVVGTRSGATWLDPADWIGIVQRVHRKVGVALAKKWDMPEPVTNGIRDCDAYDQQDKACVANAVRLANALAKQAGLYVGEVSPDEIKSHIEAGCALLQIDGDAATALGEGIKARVQELLQ